MTIIESILLGLFQGATEFLPVSSSGHLALLQIINGLDNVPLLYDVVLHLATLAAVLTYYRRDIVAIIQNLFTYFIRTSAPSPRDGWGIYIIAASVPTALIGLWLRNQVKPLGKDLSAVSIFLIITAIILLIPSFPRYRRVGLKSEVQLNLKIALIIGIVQGLAVLPGISRSGFTIVVAIILGMEAVNAARFSFLLSIPAIAGAGLLEALKLGSEPSGISFLCFISGFLAAFIVGLLSIHLLITTIKKQIWWLFSIYLIVIVTILSIPDFFF